MLGQPRIVVGLLPDRMLCTRPCCQGHLLLEDCSLIQNVNTRMQFTHPISSSEDNDAEEVPSEGTPWCTYLLVPCACAPAGTCSAISREKGHSFQGAKTKTTISHAPLCIVEPIPGKHSPHGIGLLAYNGDCTTRAPQNSANQRKEDYGEGCNDRSDPCS